MSKIVLLGQTTHQAAAAEFVGLPFELAPDSALCQRFPKALPLLQLIGDFEDKKAQAYTLARRLLENEPPLRGVRQLGVFEEVVIRELQRGYHVLHLHDRLLADGIDECAFVESSSLGSELASLANLLGSKLRVTAANAERNSRGSSLKRSWQRLRASGLALSALRSELHQVAERIDPFHRRHALRRKKKQWRRNEIWFFTTAHTFTNIGLLYESYFPQKLRFLVENALTGGKPLKEIGRPYVPLYDFADDDFVPSALEVTRSRGTIEHHLMNSTVAGSEKILRDLFVRSAFFQTFLGRHLRYGLFASRVFENWLDTVQPEALVVGNPGFEGPALHLAGQRGIPTLILQHGILGDFCQFIDPPTDRYVVRGEFWRDFLAPAARPRALVLNPPKTRPFARESSGPRRSIVFLTAPYSMQEFWNKADLDDIIRVLVETAATARVELVIRVHPLEQVAVYRLRLETLLGKALHGVEVTFSQGSELHSTLLRAAVAVTYASTAFLDCIEQGVPLVSFDWHHFSYKRQIEKFGVFHFAQNLAHLRQLLSKALQGSLPAYSAATERFLANSSEDELRRELIAATHRADAQPAHQAEGTSMQVRVPFLCAGAGIS